ASAASPTPPSSPGSSSKPKRITRWKGRPGRPFRFRHHVAVKKASILALLALAVVAPASATTGHGLYGVVMRGPTKPVCSIGEPCSEPATHTKLRFLRGTAVVSSVVTDARGRYRVRLPRGVYVVRVA